LQTQYLATAVASRRKRDVALVVGPGDAHRGHRRGLRFDAEVGEDVTHQGLVGEQATEGGAVRGMVGRLGDGAAHQPGRAEHAVEPGVVDHLDDRPDAAALFADELRERAVEFDLRRGVRAVAELVLQPLDVEPVARPSREHPREQVAREPGGACASTRNASHIGAEQNHLCP
jgi:hypothetical protein